MSITPKQTRQEADAKKVAFERNEMTGEITAFPYDDFSYEEMFEKMDNEDAIFLDSKNRKELMRELVQIEAKKLTADGLMKIFSMILDTDNPKLDLDVIIRCYGLPLRENQSDARIARIHGISRQAFSVRVLTMCGLLNVRPPRTLKAPEHRKEYALTNRPNFKPQES